MPDLTAAEDLHQASNGMRVAALEALYAVGAGGLYVSGASDALTRLLSTPIRRRHDRFRGRRTLPVLLLHGLAHNQSWSVKIQRELSASGFVSRAINYHTFSNSLDQCADIVAEQIFELAEKSQTDRVHVAAHSVGGLVLRAAINRHEDLHGTVATGVTIGSPHHGTPWARSVPGLLPKVGRLIEELRPGSATLAALDAATRAGGTKWISIWSTSDEIVPGNSGRLDHAALDVEQIELSGLGHYGITYNERGVDAIVRSLTQADNALAAARHIVAG